MSIKESIQRLADTKEEVYSIVAEVISVDTTDRTCDVRPLNGQADLYGVRLQADLSMSEGVVHIPEVGSNVVITFLGKNNAYVALCSEVQQILLHGVDVQLGGANGEKIALGETLNDTLAELNTNLNNLLTYLLTFSSTQAAASAGTLAPLAAGYTALGTSVTSLQATVATWEAKLSQHLSTTTTSE